MDRLTPKVVARYAVVVPFKPKSGVPTLAIGGRHYVLSTDGGPLGDKATGDHDMLGEPQEGGAKLIQVQEHSVPWRFLWAFDTEHKTLGMWRVTDGNEKQHGPANSEQARIVRLEKRGELNRVTSAEMSAIERHMRGLEDDVYKSLQKTIEESKTDLDRQVDRLAQEFFDHHVKEKLERAVDAVHKGVIPLGFKPFGPAEHKTRQAITHVIGQVLRREMSTEKFEAFLATKGLDADLDPQAPEWAIQELTDKLYEKYLPGREFSARVAARFAALDVAYGPPATALSFEKDFPPTTKCSECGGDAKIAIGIREPSKEDTYVHDLYKDGENDEFWPHDCASFAIYICPDPDCAKATTLWNQA